MQEMTVYVAKNGRKFEVKAECELYERLIFLEDDVHDMLTNAGVPPKKVSEYVEVICKWEACKESMDWPEPGRVLDRMGKSL